MKWNLRLVAANRGIWKSSELQRMLADAGLVISAGKMSHLWSGMPVTIRLDDLDVICEVLDCEIAELLIREPEKVRARVPQVDTVEHAAAVGAEPLRPVRRRIGRSAPPL
jgi:putative transcriptional regulator